MAGSYATRTIRLFPIPPFNPAKLNIGGQTVSVAAGSYVDAPLQSAQAAPQFFGNVWSGTTAQRPAPGDSDIGSSLRTGTEFIDTTLGKTVVWNGVNWIDPASGATV